MIRSTFHIEQMDCASEEQMIRMKLEGNPDIRQLSFDIPGRTLVVLHEGAPEVVSRSIDALKLGSRLVKSEQYERVTPEDSGQITTQRKLLWGVLLINFGCFVLEMTTGLISGSMGLVADSLDMLADALVYALALIAVGSTIHLKRNIAKAAGYFQLVLAILGVAEVIRRFAGSDVPPAFTTMIVISLIALTGNALTLWLLQKSRSNEPHMRASMIFTSNDVIINLGVIVAAVLVYYTDSNKPDLIVGSIVFVIVTRGAFRILKLAK